MTVQKEPDQDITRLRNKRGVRIKKYLSIKDPKEAPRR